MSAEAIGRHLREYRDLLERAEALDGADVSVVDGIVMMTPMTPEHSDSIIRAVIQLDPQLDASLAMHTDVQFTHPAWPADRYPDLAVRSLPTGEEEQPPFDASRLLLAIEVVSISSVENDYAIKADEFRMARVPLYLVLDPYTRTWRLHTEPSGLAWGSITSQPYGGVINLPLPEGPILRLDTSRLPAAPVAKQRDSWPAHRLSGSWQ